MFWILPQLLITVFKKALLPFLFSSTKKFSLVIKVFLSRSLHRFNSRSRSLSNSWLEFFNIFFSFVRSNTFDGMQCTILQTTKKLLYCCCCCCCCCCCTVAPFFYFFCTKIIEFRETWKIGKFLASVNHFLFVFSRTELTHGEKPNPKTCIFSSSTYVCGIIILFK